ncbi:MAG: ATP-binding protein [Saprospiraceae bacterium]
MIKRTLSDTLLGLSQKYPVVFLTGPRQSGKTTLLKSLFPGLPYVSLEDPDTFILVNEDPRGYLANYPEGAVIDEAQRIPQIFSYLQGIVDDKPEVRFILSGSQNFLLMNQISQSLAGRAAVLNLLPLSMEEMQAAGLGFSSYEDAIYKGLFPRIYDRHLEPYEFYPSYLNTFVERDVRQLQNIGDLSTFTRFVRLCAGRVGQVLNVSSLATDAAISTNTAESWLSVLEASFILFRLMPHHKNFNKRIIKRPKLYFYDTGLAASLLFIESRQQLDTHYAKGALFENLIISEFLKYRLNRGRQPNLYFWRDNHGHEVDCVLDHAGELTPVELKSGKTMNKSYFDGLKYWNKLTGHPLEKSYVVYGGEQSLSTGFGQLLSWRDALRVMPPPA